MVILPAFTNLYNAWYAIHLSFLKKIPRKFILWDSCKSKYAVEPWKNIKKRLEKNGIDFHIYSAKKLKKLKRKNDGIQYAIKLKKGDIIIEFWVSVSGGPFFYDTIFFHNWVCVRFEKREENSQYLGKIENLIGNIVEKLPENNPFCSNCNKSKEATCYGPNNSVLDRTDNLLLKILVEKINPYQDEETFNELVEKKKQLDGKSYSLEEFEKEFKKYIDE